MDKKIISIKTRERSKPYNWKVLNKSNLPKQMFRYVIGWIGHAIKKYGISLKSVIKGLQMSALTCCCEGKAGSKVADYYWYLEKQKFIAWQIHKRFEDAERIALLEQSKAPLRIVVLLNEDGTFELLPKRTRWILD